MSRALQISAHSASAARVAAESSWSLMGGSVGIRAWRPSSKPAGMRTGPMSGIIPYMGRCGGGIFGFEAIVGRAAMEAAC